MSQPHYYTLEIRYLHKQPEVRRIEAARLVIGRDGGDIVLRDPQASAAHAEIEFQNGQLVVRDLGSTNGTWLGQRTLPQFALSPGQLSKVPTASTTPAVDHAARCSFTVAGPSAATE